ncbi:MAG TPA: dihydrofolate reductase family protein [Candidatus Limnocylindrales bacterium]|nr:dihydrofolate reductase family protein [Candidatus Limnocylindrales bacterium]
MTVFFEASMSLDGFTAGPNITPQNPMGDGGEELHGWMFADKSDEEMAAYQDALFESVGALVMGRRTLNLGLGPWGDNPPYHAPVFVVTHEPHEPIEKLGGTTFTFVTDGFEVAFQRARDAAGAKDVQIMGGAEIDRLALAAGVVDEIRLHIAPMLLGGGTRLFDGAEVGPAELEMMSAESDLKHGVIHVRYRVI